jgi:hypothetical protein
MDTQCIKQSTRPNLHKLTEVDLLKIINYYEPEWINDKYTRDDMVLKIFKLWSEYVIIDNNSNPIECLICWDLLTNGNNMTFECGHKFHSSCIVKSMLIHSTDSYINKMNDDEIQGNFMIEYCCPQCKKCIDKIHFTKLHI